MDKRSDQELIEEAEGLLTLPSTDLSKELAKRLKATNEKLAKVAQEDEDMAGMPSTSPTLARLFKTRAEALRR